MSRVAASFRWEAKVFACRRNLIDLVLPETPADRDDGAHKVKIRYALERLEQTAIRYGIALERAKLEPVLDEEEDDDAAIWSGPVTADEVRAAWKAVEDREAELELERAKRRGRR